MSYILDALTRSEQERNRGSVPDVHTVQAPFRQTEAPRRSHAGLLVVSVLLAGGGAAAAGWLHVQDPDRGKSASMQAEPVAIGRPQVLAAAATPSIPAFPDPPAAKDPQPSVPVTLAEDPRPTVRAAAKPKNEKPSRPAAVTARASATPPPTAGSGELPDALQKELAQLAISGFADSRDTGRMAVINGRVVVEGDEVVGLTVERIAPHSLTLRYKDQRIRHSY